MDMQHSGCDTTELANNVNSLNKLVKFYALSRYSSPDMGEIALIKSLYDDISCRILKLKTNPSVIPDIKVLYSVYCSVRLMLRTSVFKSVSRTYDAQNKALIISKNHHIKRIYECYLQCIDALNKIAPSQSRPTYSREHEFADKNVLIGSLRNREQLDICLEHCFYHIPAHSLPMDAKNVRYIAIYQSKNFFGKYAGIKYYGRVIGFQLTKRYNISEIPSNSDTDYYKFIVDSWQSLPEMISSSGGGTAFAVTSFYQLLRADDICELHFTNHDEYKLYCSIHDALTKGMNRVARRYQNITFEIEDAVISAYKNKKRCVSVSSKDYLANPGYYFWKMVKN